MEFLRTYVAELSAGAALIVIVGTFRKSVISSFRRILKLGDDSSAIAAFGIQNARELAKILAEKAEETGSAKAEVSVLRDTVFEKDIQIAGLIGSIEALQKERLEASPEKQATIDDALSHLAEGRTEDATALLRNIAEEKAAAGEAAAAYRHLGAMAFLNNTQEALSAYTKAVELDPDDPDGWNQLGHLQLRLGELADAERSYQKVLAIGNMIKDQESVAIATSNLGQIFRARGDLEQAEALFKKSLEIDIALARKEGIASNYSNLGIIYEIRGQLDHAEAMHTKSLELFAELGRKEGVGNQYCNLGNVYNARGDLDQAEIMHKKSLKIFKTRGHKDGMARQYGNLEQIRFTPAHIRRP